MMATAIQKNGMKSLTNGNLNHVGDVEHLDHGNICNGSGDNGVYVLENIADDEQEPQPEIDILIRNVVCSFSVRCHLNLREIALNGSNVEYKRENGMITMKLRKPSSTATMWSSGKITCTGAETEEEAKIAARRFARTLQKLGFNARFNNFRVVNVLGTCLMPWAIRIVQFSTKHRDCASYEPELHPGVTYKLVDPKATLKIFSTGSVTITAPSVDSVGKAIEHIFPLVYEFRKERSMEEEALLLAKKRKLASKRFADEFNHDEIIKNPVMAYDEDMLMIGSDGSWD